MDDNLPFTPTGKKLASIAWRTWIYTDTGTKRTRYGYYRAGEVFDARGSPIVNEGCAGGWWRVNPRGFVCVGKGATRRSAGSGGRGLEHAADTRPGAALHLRDGPERCRRCSTSSCRRKQR